MMKRILITIAILAFIALLPMLALAQGTTDTGYAGLYNSDGRFIGPSQTLYSAMGGGGVSDGDKGDVTVSGSGATWTVDNTAISNAKLRDSAALSVIGRSANSSGAPADIAAASDGDVLRRSGTSIGFGTVLYSSISGGTATRIPFFDGSGILAHDSGGPFWDATNDTMVFGDYTAAGIPIFGLSTVYPLLTIRDDDASQLSKAYEGASDTASTSPNFAYFRARGTNASPTSVVAGDSLGSNSFWGYETSGTDSFFPAASMDARAHSVAAGEVQGELAFQIWLANIATDYLVINPDGIALNEVDVTIAENLMVGADTSGASATVDGNVIATYGDITAVAGSVTAGGALNGATGAITNELTVADEAYDATGWNASLEVPTKNAVRDEIESLATGYTLSVFATNYASPGDAETRYFGAISAAPTATADESRVYIPKTGTITRANILGQAGTAGSNEAWTLYIRLNNTTDTSIEAVSAATALRLWDNSALSIAVTAGDYIEIKSVTPTWASNAVNVRFAGTIFIE